MRHAARCGVPRRIVAHPACPHIPLPVHCEGCGAGNGKGCHTIHFRAGGLDEEHYCFVTADGGDIVRIHQLQLGELGEGARCKGGSGSVPAGQLLVGTQLPVKQECLRAHPYGRIAEMWEMLWMGSTAGLPHNIKKK